MAPERTRTTAQAQAEGLRVFVAGIPWRLGEDSLRRDFEECGLVEDLFLLRDKEGNSTGRCFITFRDQDGVKAALEFNNTDYGGRTVYVKLAETKDKGQDKGKDSARKQDPKGWGKGGGEGSAKSYPESKPDGCRSLCLKNLGEATEQDLRTMMKECTIQSVRMVVDRITGESRGIAFIDFKESAEVDKAMEHNGEELHGRAVEMHYEAPRERPRPDGCMTVAIKKLHAQTQEKDILKLFKGLESIEEVRIILNQEKECSGLAFVEFSDPKDVEAAVGCDGMKSRGQIVFICYETKQKKSSGTKDRRKLAAQKRVKDKKKKGTGGEDSGDDAAGAGAEDGDGDAGQDGGVQADGGSEAAATKGSRKTDRRREKRRAVRQAASTDKADTPAEEDPTAVAEGSVKAKKKKSKKKPDAAEPPPEDPPASGKAKKKKQKHGAVEEPEAEAPKKKKRKALEGQVAD